MLCGGSTWKSGGPRDGGKHMALSRDAVRRIREAFNQATGTPFEEDAFAERFGIPTNSERDGLTGPGALALRYLS